MSTYLQESATGFNDFTPEELKQNREGKFTPEQLKRIRRIASSEKKMQKIICIVMAVFLSVFCIVVLLQENVQHLIAESYRLALTLCLALGLPIFFLTVSYLFGKSLNQEFMNVDRPSSIQGVVTKHAYSSDGVDSYSVKVEHIKFPVNEKLFNVVEENQMYAFYYVPATGYNLILSWEKL